MAVVPMRKNEAKKDRREKGRKNQKEEVRYYKYYSLGIRQWRSGVNSSLLYPREVEEIGASED